MRLIDPINALILCFGANPGIQTVIGQRIADRHKFAMDGSRAAWPRPSNALIITADPGGSPDLDVTDQTGRAQLRCYGERPSEARRLYLAVVARTRTIDKVKVVTSNGTALIYYAVMDTSPQAGLDADINVDVVLATIRYHIYDYALEDVA